MAKPNYAVGANGITAKEYADAVRDGAKTGGASDREASRAGSKAHRSAVKGGAQPK
jgi:hypothetical protein